MGLTTVRIAAIAAVMFLGVVVGQAQTPRYIHGDFPRWQPGTAAQIVGVESDINLLGKAVLVWNSGSSTLTQIRIGAALRNETTTLKIYWSANQTVSIPAGAVARVNLAGWSEIDAMDTMIANNAINGVLFVGILSAQWADSSQFTFDLAEAQTFQKVADSGLEGQYTNFTVDQLNSAMGSIGTAIGKKKYWTCATSFALGHNKYCRNNVSTCQTLACPDPAACPDQSCVEVNSNPQPGGGDTD